MIIYKTQKKIISIGWLFPCPHYWQICFWQFRDFPYQQVKAINLKIFGFLVGFVKAGQ